MLVIGVFIPVVQATNGAANAVRGRVLVDVYIKHDATTPPTTPGSATRSCMRRTSRASQFVSKAQALAQQSKRTRRPTRLLGYNPLPDTFHVYRRQPSRRAARSTAELTQGGSGRRRPARSIDSAIASVSNTSSDTRRSCRSRAW